MPFAFDVSGNYKTFWDAFVPPGNQACYEVPEAWRGRMDAVLSFFALEHVADPLAFARTVVALLKPHGRLHLVFPNPRRNPGDLIVADHINHFMPTSIELLLTLAGCTDITIDDTSHTAAYVVEAVRSDPHTAAAPPAADVAAFVDEAQRNAAFWSDARERVERFERNEAKGRRAVIYGSGFYGVFIASALRELSSVSCFLDRNPHQQRKRPLGKDVKPPEAIEPSDEVVYVGLNPLRAGAIIADVAPLHSQPRRFFFL